MTFFYLSSIIFISGAVSIPWQEEMVETKVFEELNIFDIDQEYPSRPPLDLDLNYVPEPEPKGCLPFLFSKLRTKSTDRPPLAISNTTNTTNEENIVGNNTATELKKDVEVSQNVR